MEEATSGIVGCALTIFITPILVLALVSFRTLAKRAKANNYASVVKCYFIFNAIILIGILASVAIICIYLL